MKQSKKEKELWHQFLEEEYTHLFKELESVSDPELRSQLKDQLIWLRHQMKNFEQSHDLEAIQEDYTWTINSLSRHLHPAKPFKENPHQK